MNEPKMYLVESFLAFCYIPGPVPRKPRAVSLDFNLLQTYRSTNLQ